MSDTLRSISKMEYEASPGLNTFERINTGSLQRIADATELMAKSYANIVAERDRYELWYHNSQSANASLARTNAALRGHITKLKKRIETLEDR